MSSHSIHPISLGKLFHIFAIWSDFPFTVFYAESIHCVKWFVHRMLLSPPHIHRLMGALLSVNFKYTPLHSKVGTCDMAFFDIYCWPLHDFPSLEFKDLPIYIEGRNHSWNLLTAAMNLKWSEINSIIS